MTLFLDYYRGDAGQRLLLRQGYWLVATGIALWAVFSGTDLDRAVTRLFFDSEDGAFPLTNTWLLKTVLHDDARIVSASCALAVVLATIVAWLGSDKLRLLRERRHELAFVSAALLGGSLLVNELKHLSAHACPWALTDFGGTATYAHLFGRAHAALAVDGCLPAAHPLSGYAWLCVSLALFPSLGSKAWRWWQGAFALGTVLGVVQIARGAHFLSHVLWTAWVVWLANVALLALLSLSCRSSSRTRSPSRPPHRAAPDGTYTRRISPRN